MTGYSMLRRATPRYRTTPTSGRGTNYYRATLGESAAQDATNEMMRSRFDFRRASRWHSIRIDHDDTAVVNGIRSEEQTSELQSLMRISYAVFCLKKKKGKITICQL